ncbi:MAG: glycosyltransferase family 4 protein, partial [Psychroflexus sp.]
MSKKILVITSYFPPETGAASNRIFALANQLQLHDYRVSVISPLPNYPHGKVFKKYKGKFMVKEKFKGVAVIRLFIFASKSTNKIVRLFSILSYAFFLFFFLLFTKTPDRYIIQCSPLFVGYFAVLAGKIKGKTVILNVSDLWPLAGLEMGVLSKGFYYNILEYMESFIYKNSSKVIGQSEEILKHVKSKIPKQHKTLFLYRNFPDFKIDFTTENKNENEFRFVYAGLIGVAQGIEEICRKVNFPKGSSFHIYGGGPMEDEVKNICQKKERIFYKGSLSREELHKT